MSRGRGGPRASEGRGYVPGGRVPTRAAEDRIRGRRRRWLVAECWGREEARACSRGQSLRVSGRTRCEAPAGPRSSSCSHSERDGGLGFCQRPPPSLARRPCCSQSYWSSGYDRNPTGHHATCQPGWESPCHRDLPSCRRANGRADTECPGHGEEPLGGVGLLVTDGPQPQRHSA